MTHLLHDWVTRQAATRPEADAVIARDERLSYGVLEARSNQVAALLRDAGCRRHDRVALLAPKSPAALVAMLGIYKADCIFVPLDPASPVARLTKVLRSCEPRYVLAAPATGAMLDELGAPGRADWLEKLDAFATRPPSPLNTDRDVAHILFTSGSTGTPKGVMVTHGSVVAFVEWARRYFGIGPYDRVSGHSPLHFDLSTFDVFGAFAAGAELHLVAPELNYLPHRLVEFIRERALTQWFSVPSVLAYVAKFDAVAANDLPALKRLLWCGEVFPTPALIYWMTRLPHVAFTNLYGPTETTIASASYTLPACPADPSAEIPIGRPCEGEQLLVLDEQLQPTGIGQVGDLYISGVGLSPGYWEDPERTADVFRPHPTAAGTRIYRTGDLARVGADGNVYFVGRADTQIKSRGYRIELGEIEAALSTVDGLRESAVVAVPTGGFEGAVVACAYAPLPGRRVTPVDLRQALSVLIPSYMLPARWCELTMLPRNGSGKIDRRALRERFETRDALTA